MKIKSAGKFFAYLGKYFPVMCASGAFEYMPPVNDAAKWLDRLDDLSHKGIDDHVVKLTRFRQDFETAAAKADTPEERAAARALVVSAGCAVTELGHIRSWDKSPDYYLRVAFTGLEQAVGLPSKNARTLEKRFVKRLRAIPALLAQAPKNIEAISPVNRAKAQTMVRDCARYLSELGGSDLGKAGKTGRYLEENLAALRDFDRFVSTRPEVPEPEGPPFAHMIETVLGTDRSAADIFAMAEEEYRRRQETLRAMESSLGKPWQEALDGYAGPAEEGMTPLDVVVREMHRLRSFVFETALSGVFSDSGLKVDLQPLHLASTLRPIHYDPALGAWPDEQSRCHVSPQLFSGRGFRDDPSRLRRMRRECLFMTARQTYPGRHLLDSQRRALGDSPMAQVTSPLFMAGWLALAENLLDELGYLETDLDRLVHHHRGLCRAALAMIDAGLAVGNLDQDRCLKILGDAGFSSEESLDRVRAIRLSPASRVMPVLGLSEMNAMREASGLDARTFCSRLFARGQLPLDHLAGLMR
jgi:hypothetical protein